MLFHNELERIQKKLAVLGSLCYVIYLCRINRSVVQYPPFVFVQFRSTKNTASRLHFNPLLAFSES
jgi:hypothetical protein